MSRGLLDTSVLISQELRRVLAEAELPQLSHVSVISIGELRAGVLVAPDPLTTTVRMSTLERAQAMAPLPVDDRVASAWAALRTTLGRTGRRMPVNDSWIAATALAHDLVLYSQDDDYDDVPGLSVVRV